MTGDTGRTVITLRLENADKQVLERMAKDRNTTVSELIRQQIKKLLLEYYNSMRFPHNMQ